MKLMKLEQVTSKEQAHDLAVEWQHWQSNQSLSWSEMADWADLFAELGERFGLTEEFTDNGII